MYNKLVEDHQIGNVQALHAILSPFVGNKFDPRYLQDSSDRSRDFIHNNLIRGYNYASSKL